VPLLRFILVFLRFLFVIMILVNLLAPAARILGFLVRGSNTV
jgi:hypothetical protein